MEDIGELARALLGLRPYGCLHVDGTLQVEHRPGPDAAADRPLWRLVGDFTIAKEDNTRYAVYLNDPGREVSAFHLDVKSGLWFLNSRNITAAHALFPKTYITLEGRVVETQEYRKTS